LGIPGNTNRVSIYSNAREGGNFLSKKWNEEYSKIEFLTKLVALIFTTTVIHKLELKTLKSLKSHGGVDRALLSFDIHADMEPAFHWNVKQLFVYVVASYETESKKINQVVIWDKILEAIDPVKEIKQDNVFVKYALVDQGDELRGKDVQLQLMWDHMPITGFLYMGEQPKETMTQFTLPSEYQ
jgi:signal peptidase complex subunit 3